MFKIETAAARATTAVVALVALAVGPAQPATAQDGAAARARLVVDVEWLARHLEDDNLVLLHVGREAEYRAEHIPGAQHITLDDLSAPEDHEGGKKLSLELPTPEQAVQALEGLGIGDHSRIVVYYGNDWVTPSARVMFTLDWIGLGGQSSLLDGGMRAWKKAGHPVTAEIAPVRPGTLTARPRSDLVVTADWVNRHLAAAGYRVLDARAPVHYDGIEPTYLHSTPVRKGHIPGAANLPFSQIIDEELRIKPATALQQLYREAGVGAGDTVVAYCHLGQYATLVLFGARTLGHDVKLYDGSFQEWGGLEQFPVEVPGR